MYIYAKTAKKDKQREVDEWHREAHTHTHTHPRTMMRAI